MGLDGKLLSESTAAEISPYDQNLAYAPYKGTTIYRKTMAESALTWIPREWAGSKFTLRAEDFEMLRKIRRAQKESRGGNAAGMASSEPSLELEIEVPSARTGRVVSKVETGRNSIEMTRQ